MTAILSMNTSKTAAYLKSSSYSQIYIHVHMVQNLTSKFPHSSHSAYVDNRYCFGKIISHVCHLRRFLRYQTIKCTDLYTVRLIHNQYTRRVTTSTSQLFHVNKPRNRKISQADQNSVSSYFDKTASPSQPYLHTRLETQFRSLYQETYALEEISFFYT